MLASQRDLFEMPRNICYLNSASYSPLPLKTQEAGRAAVGRKGTPWTLDAGFAKRQHARARAGGSRGAPAPLYPGSATPQPDRPRATPPRLLNAEPADIALIPSISYGVA